nr:PepSY-associated TM helix domain-containing protein [Novosphingobium sp. BW1]
MKQLHTWHWISAALSLVGMLLFTATGFTLNHAADIPAEPVRAEMQGALSSQTLRLLDTENTETRPLPPPVAAAVREITGLSTTGIEADWSASGEVYLAMPGPGSDAWVSIDTETGEVLAERTDRGWISYLNDLHKGRNTGSAWGWFIDLFAFACLVFTLTGLVLLQLHARNRPLTWPLTGLGLVIPLAVALLFIH